eukprot:scaffold46985_cov38-Tisochrysis_lutea.AAC.2
MGEGTSPPLFPLSTPPPLWARSANCHADPLPAPHRLTCLARPRLSWPAHRSNPPPPLVDKQTGAECRGWLFRGMRGVCLSLSACEAFYLLASIACLGQGV